MPCTASPMNQAGREAFLADPAAYPGGFRLAPAQHAVFVAPDIRAIVALGVHPLVAFLANMQLERQRES
jgi:2,3-dihydroxyphenylpropionate 1,2-dioxygenase